MLVVVAVIVLLFFILVWLTSPSLSEQKKTRARNIERKENEETSYNYTEAKERIEILESCTMHFDEDFLKYMRQKYNNLNNILDEEVDSIYLKQLEKYLGVQPFITFYEDELKAILRDAIRENKTFNMMDAYNLIETEEEMQAIEEN